MSRNKLALMAQRAGFPDRRASRPNGPPYLRGMSHVSRPFRPQIPPRTCPGPLARAEEFRPVGPGERCHINDIHQPPCHPNGGALHFVPVVVESRRTIPPASEFGLNPVAAGRFVPADPPLPLTPPARVRVARSTAGPRWPLRRSTAVARSREEVSGQSSRAAA